MKCLQRIVRTVLACAIMSGALAGTWAWASLTQEQSRALREEAASGDKAALKKLMAEAQQEDPDAQWNLGILYHLGQGVPQDYGQAAQWFRKAAEQGNVQAQNSLGALYGKGQGVAQDYGQAVRWFRKAAEQGNAQAQRNLGLHYAQGLGLSKNKVVAYALFNLSAARNSSSLDKARNNRSSLARSMTNQEVEAGQALTRQVISAGSLQPLDQYLAGSTVKEKEEPGAGTPERSGLTTKQAAALQRDAASGNKAAFEKLMTAARQANPYAQFSLGVLYAQGKGVTQDYGQAALWYRKAAQQGEVKAQNDLGVLYLKGKGVAQDYGQAALWFRKAAEQGAGKALNSLGGFYANGWGLPQNKVAAYALFSLSAVQDPASKEKALNNRSLLVKEMTSQEVQIGQALTGQIARARSLKPLDQYLANPAVKRRKPRALSA
ncbi:MAG: sel1 repeat family protein [Burkholderiaceae bacterium]|nr:sel1 repeat family protein [Burkholderiaceae bacterium]